MKLTTKLLKEMVRKELQEAGFIDRNQAQADVEFAKSDEERAHEVSSDVVADLYSAYQDNIKAADDIYWEDEDIDSVRSFLEQNRIKNAGLVANLIALGRFDDLMD